MPENEPGSSKSGLKFSPYLPLMATTTIIWGSAFPITKPGLADLPPATFALLRFVICVIILVPLVYAVRGGWHIPRHAWGRVVLAGFMGFTVIQLGQNWGLTMSTASDISVLAATEPVSIALLASYFLGEKPSRSLWLGLLLSLAGVLLVIGVNPLSLFAGQGDGKDSARLLGDLVFLGGTLGFAAYNVMSRSLNQRYNGLELTTGGIMAGVLGLAPFALLELLFGNHPVRFTGAAIGGLLYTSLLVTVFGFLCLSWALKRVPAARVALLFYLQPVSGVVVAWLGGEQLSWTFAVGALLIMAGVYIGQQPDKSA